MAKNHAITHTNIQRHSLLNSVLVAGEWSAPTPGRFTRGDLMRKTETFLRPYRESNANFPIALTLSLVTERERAITARKKLQPNLF